MNAVTIHKDHWEILREYDDSKLGLLLRALMTDIINETEIELPADLAVIRKYIHTQNKRFSKQQSDKRNGNKNEPSSPNPPNSQNEPIYPSAPTQPSVPDTVSESNSDTLPEVKPTPTPPKGGDEGLFDELRVPDNAKQAHITVIEWLERKGYTCEKEYLVSDRGDGKPGRVDIFAKKETHILAIEIDRFTPRDKSIFKLKQIKNAEKIILLRGGSFNEFIGDIRAISIEHIKTQAAQEPPVPKEKYAEFVSMTNDEHTSLVTKLGEQGTARCIEILDNYKGSKGKKYESDYRAILSWVITRYNEEQGQKPIISQKDNAAATGDPWYDSAREAVYELQN